MVSAKEIIFFVLVLVLFFVFAKLSNMNTLKYKIKPNISIAMNGIIFTLLLILVFVLTKVGKDCKDTFDFEVTPAKLCDGGPYMYSSNPERQELCSHITNSQLAQVSCGPGFVGRPVKWDHTNMSNDKWENNMCDPKGWNANSPCVL